MIQTILVVGAGVMGSSIAQTAAQSGHTTLLYDAFPGVAVRARLNLVRQLERLTEKGKISAADMQQTLGRLHAVESLEEGADADVVIEAAMEHLERKRELFASLDQVLKPEAILATNTSSLSITAIAAATARPDKVIGMHFFNPVPLMALVEVIRGAATTAQSSNAIAALARAMGKTPVFVEEAPGFVVNRLLIPMINEAAFVLGESVATAEDIDAAMRLGANHPLGPLALGDLVGLDVCLAIMEVLQSESSDAKYRPAPLLRKMVRAGRLGRKSGQGFFNYS